MEPKFPDNKPKAISGKRNCYFPIAFYMTNFPFKNKTPSLKTPSLLYRTGDEQYGVAFGSDKA